jgi:prophage antirepressor-like protein
MTTETKTHTGNDRASTHTTGAALVRTVDFEGHPVTAVMFRGRWVWPCAEVGAAIGYEQGRRLVDKIRDEWADDFRVEVDFETLRGADLKAFRELSTDSVETSKYAGRLVVLTASGIDRALILSRTEKGRRLRDMLVDHVLPQLRATGSATLPGAPVALTAAQVREIAMGAAAEAVNPIVERLAVVLDRMRVVEHAQIPRAEVIFCGATEGARLRAGMRRVAHLRTAHLRPRTDLPTGQWNAAQIAWRRQWKRELGEVQREVQDATHHEGLGKAWDYLPIRDLTPAWETIHRLEAIAERAKERRIRESGDPEAQKSLNFDAKPAAPNGPDHSKN